MSKTPSTPNLIATQSDSHLILNSEDLLRHLKLSQQLPQIIREITTQHIILATARERGISISDEALQAAADNFRSERQLTSAEQTWQWLQHNFLNLEDLETILQTQLTAAMLAHQLFDHKVEPHFAQFYNDNAKAQFYEIVVEDEDWAMELFYSLKSGEASFAELASQHSMESELRRHGGYRGQVKRSQLPPELALPIFAAQPPALLKPITVKDRSHLIWVEKIRWPQLTDKRRQEICDQLFRQWLNEQIDKLEVTLG